MLEGSHTQEVLLDVGFEGGTVRGVRIQVVLLVGGLFMVAAIVGGVGYAFRWDAQTIQCDGSVPAWMIEAQDYDGGGCAEVLPTSEAPADADWSPYCLGYCILDKPRGQGGAPPDAPVDRMLPHHRIYH
jgi:hypothetical protein